MAARLGRPRRYAEFEDFLASLPRLGLRRPKYLHGIGIFRGEQGDTAWIKIRVRHGATFRGRSYASGGAIEMKLGKLASWSWQQLEAKRNEYQGRADRDEPLEEAELPLFRDWADEWLKAASSRLRSYPIVSVHVRKQLTPTFGLLRIDKIGPTEINRWIGQRLKAASPATVKRELATLSGILGSAVRARLISKNPCAEADTITGVVGRQRFLTGEELLRLLAAATSIDEALADLILWFVHSGMRRGEVLALGWTDVRVLADGRVYVQVRRSKSDTSRLIACTRTMVEVIDRQKKRSRGGGRLFPISSMTLRRRWERAREVADLCDVTVHDLRRTHATHAAAGGVDLRTLADRIGHGSLAMLQRHYAAVVGTAAGEAAEKVQSTFDQLIPEAKK